MTTVVKLGGSLLHQSDWPDRFRRWFQRQPADFYLLTVGGGKLIDALRELDVTHKLSQPNMHWRCIRALDATLEIASELLPEAKVIRHLVDWQDATGQQCSEKKPLFLARLSGFYTNADPVGKPPWPTNDATPMLPKLPEDWSTTSDALTVAVAISLAANRVVLLKSCPIPENISLRQAAEAGIVDSVTPTLNFPVRIEQLK